MSSIEQQNIHYILRLYIQDCWHELDIIARECTSMYSNIQLS